MHKDTAAIIDPFLDEGITAGKMLDNILVIHVVNLDHVMFEVDEQVVIQG